MAKQAAVEHTLLEKSMLTLDRATFALAVFGGTQRMQEEHSGRVVDMAGDERAVGTRICPILDDYCILRWIT